MLLKLNEENRGEVIRTLVVCTFGKFSVVNQTIKRSLTDLLSYQQKEFFARHHYLKRLHLILNSEGIISDIFLKVDHLCDVIAVEFHGNLFFRYLGGIWMPLLGKPFRVHPKNIRKFANFNP